MKKLTITTIALFIFCFSFAQSWNLTGNSDATGASFLGTTTDIDLVFKRFGTIAGRIDATKFNTSLGINTLELLTNGTDNTAIGHRSSINITSGSYNTALGRGSLQANSTGAWNTALGRGSLTGTTGSYNTGVGGAANGYNISGSYNTAVGTFTLFANTLGSYNTVLGYSANTGSNNLLNATAIGANSIVTQNNSLVLGSINGINGATANTNVGIGTSAPSAQLHTTGTVKFGGIPLNTNPLRVVVSDIDGNVGYKDAATFGSSADGSETKVNAGSNVTVSGSGTIASPYIIAATVPVIPAQQWATASIGTNNITNTNSGGIIIGSLISSLPTGYKMYVQDGILTEKLKVALKSSANWADYVFEKDYKLKPLAEVEAFVNINKHLPGVQSAAELVKDGGVDVNQMLAKQMEKIEELTLYIIEMNKKIEKLEIENKNLQIKVSK